MLTEEELQNYRRAGKILAEIREEVRKVVKPGVKLLEIAELAENLIVEKGAKPAFPCNVSVNEIAAHYSPPADDARVIEENDMVKVDLGAHVDGYIADTAFTVAFGEKQEMVQAVEKALEAAISVVKPGVDVGEIGKAVEEVAAASGFKPIKNLTGHSLARWDLHAGITIPNVGETT
ncbi:MAG: type II methionyl aminopeptidase, partial [Candidatus Hadarchaeales archaeon]